MKLVISIVFVFLLILSARADTIEVDSDVKKEIALISGKRDLASGDVCKFFLTAYSYGSYNRTFEDNGNTLENDGDCLTEVAIFSRDHGAKLRKDVTRFSNADNDVLYFDVPNKVEIPTVVWIVHGHDTLFKSIFNHEKSEFESEVKKANNIFEDSKCGLEVRVDAIYDKTHVLDSPNQKIGCGMINDFLKTEIGYDPNKMNVYLVGRLKSSGRAGVACKLESDNVILMDKGRGKVTFAHEMGHWLSLDHTYSEVMPEVNEYNIMSKDHTESRDMLTLGQCYRANFDVDSYINKKGLRDGPTKDCLHLEDHDGTCPGLKKEF